MLVDSQMVEKRGDFARAHILRVLQLMEAAVPDDPCAVGLFGALRKVASSDFGAYLIEQFHGIPQCFVFCIRTNVHILMPGCRVEKTERGGVWSSPRKALGGERKTWQRNARGSLRSVCRHCIYLVPFADK
jgi:hypothetical protein